MNGNQERGHLRPKGRYLVYLLQTGLLYLIATGFFIQDTFRAFWGMVALGITFLPLLIEFATDFKFHWVVKGSLALPMVLHIAGGVQRWYFLFYPWYDKIGHIVAAATLAFLLFLLFLFLAQYTTFCRNSAVLISLIILLTMFLGSAWEIAEQYLDLIYQATYYHDVIDSILDQIANLVGIAATAIFVNRKLKTFTIEELFVQFFHSEP